MKKKSGLGRGLGALIPTESEAEEQTGVLEVPVEDIYPNPRQPRTIMDSDKLAELAASILEHGLIQPLIVTSSLSGYTLIAGERRLRAAKLAGLGEVPVIVKESTPQEALELAIVENIQRADLNALEEAHAYRQLMDEFGLTQEEVADRVGKGRSTVANLVRLLNLPTQSQQAVLDGFISGAHAREILRLPTQEMQINATNQVKRLHLSRRQTATLVDNLLSEKKPKPKKRKSLTPELLALQKEFEHSLGTRVSIDQGNQGGKVVIYYYSDDDLQAIYETIVSESDQVE
ncbi:MAG: ParB/RepB/Spo0J family partition protein [Chloroflexi bacterium]|jgi:ParB family chromosome partitioning protein|nr:ParB/RepB/Spo0J family partition protein [Chloroflexota bacterium]